MQVRKFGFTLEADIHGMRAADAKAELERLIARCDSSVHEIVVIHGYHGGQALQTMVRTGLRSERILRRELSLNSGQTVLVLRR